MAEGRRDYEKHRPISGTATCQDCNAGEFVVKLYAGDTMGEAFARDHPQNGCYVKELKEVKVKRV